MLGFIIYFGIIGLLFFSGYVWIAGGLLAFFLLAISEKSNP